MSGIRGMVQAALDAAFNSEVYVFWQRKADIGDQDEYIVYTLGGDNELELIDNGQIITKEADVTVKYYHKYEMSDTPTGRTDVESREDQILTALKSAGFLCHGGFFDAGDVDEVGCFTSVAECNYWRAI
jgi:hypothetical protein